MRCLFRLRVLFIIVLSAAVAAAVATVLTQKQRLEPMSPEERRRYLGEKIGDRIPEDQIDKIAAAISARLDGASAAPEEAAPDSGSAEEAAPES
jgi:hypothetical protein